MTTYLAKTFENDCLGGKSFLEHSIVLPLKKSLVVNIKNLNIQQKLALFLIKHIFISTPCNFA